MVTVTNTPFNYPTLAKPNDALGLSRNVVKSVSASQLASSVETLSISSASKAFEKGALDLKQEWAKRQEESGGKAELSVVVVGHVDAGKSTLLGHLLVGLQKVSQRTLSKLQQASSDAGKSSFAYAWILDETECERNRGVTVDIGQQEFETTRYHVTMLDAPGHREFVPKMIMGTSQADAAILVVDASPNNFEAGFLPGSQTREHSFLVRSLGVSQIIVVVNKLDSTDWDFERYTYIKAQLELFLTTQVGFASSKITFVPCSGLSGENLVKPASGKLATWYHGPSVAQAIDSFQPPVRSLDLPLRFLVTDVIRRGASGGIFTLAGRLSQGALQVGEPISLLPSDLTGVIKSIEGFNGRSVACAFAGDTAVLCVSHVSAEELPSGLVLCSNRPSACPVPVSQEFEARILLFNLDVPVTLGTLVLMHHGASPPEAASFAKLLAVIDRTTGEVVKRNPRCLTQNTGALVRLKLPKKVAIEKFQDNRDLGRITLRKGGQTIASGIVTEIII